MKKAEAYAALAAATEDHDWETDDVRAIFTAIFGRPPDDNEDALSHCYASMPRPVTVTYSDGRESRHETLTDALDCLRREAPSLVTDGELHDGDGRVLVWSCEADSIDDPGARAIASVRQTQCGEP